MTMYYLYGGNGIPKCTNTMQMQTEIFGVMNQHIITQFKNVQHETVE